jgi:hypothetical protein
MQFKNFLDTLFYSHDLIIFMFVIGVYAAFALMIIWVVYTPRFRDFFLSLNGIHGTFYSPAASMFALAAAFMGSTLVISFNAHTDAIKDERTALLLYLDFVSNTPVLDTKNLQYKVKEYLNYALEEEWPLLEKQRTSPNTEASFKEILKQTIGAAPVLEGTQAGRQLSKIIEDWYQARSKRISFRWHEVEYLRWIALFIVAFLLQISVAATHLTSSKRAMSLAVGITTLLIVSVLIPLALNVDHYSGMLEVSRSPLIEVYEILSQQFADDR